jgi:hypothetical protein
MEIEKDGKNLIIKIPIWQSGETEWGNKWTVQNLIAVKTWNKTFDDWDYTISQANYLDYKDSLQEGMPIVHLSERVFKEFVKLLDLDIWENPPCSECKEAIYGSHTYGDKGPICFDCEHKKNDEKPK